MPTQLAPPISPLQCLLEDAELGQVAMQFVDRAGDVHPGIDDADKICADFHKAMLAVLTSQWARRDAAKAQPNANCKSAN